MNNSKSKILLVCDNDNQFQFFVNALGEYCEVLTATNNEIAKSKLANCKDIALTIVAQDDFVNLLIDIRNTYGAYVSTLVCVDGNKENSELALKYGAFDLLELPLNEEVVRNRVLNILWRSLGYQDYQDETFRNKTLLFGSVDSLTLLHNRNYGEEVMNKRLSQGIKDGYFILVDIDHFKTFNDIYGRQRGDRFLVDFANKLIDLFGKETEICRYNGDEFVIFWEIDTESKEANDKLEMLSRIVKDEFFDDSNSLCMTVSVGAVRMPINGNNFQELCPKADKALYRSKTTGRNAISFYSEKMLFGTMENEIYDITSLDYQNIMDSNRVTSICAITAKEHRILYFNKKAIEVAPKMKVGAICHEVWEHDCDTCPINVIGDAEFMRIVRFDAMFGEEVEVTATKIMWHNKIPAYLIEISPRIRDDLVQRTITVVNGDPSNAPINNEGGVVSNIKSDNKDVVVARYSEQIFCLNGSAYISKKEQSIIDVLLTLNHGVGIIAGYFDDDFSIKMISGLAIRVLQYLNYNDFWESTKACLINTVKTEEERNFLRKKLLTSSEDVWSFPLCGKNGKTVSVRISNAVGMLVDGKKMWYLSLRQFSDHHHDSLTGGYNNEGFIHSIEKLRNRNVDLTKYAILYIDIKGFKSMNDLYGSEGADNLLTMVYKRFATCKLEPIICARKGSDHYLLLVKKSSLDFEELDKLLDVTWEHNNRKLFLHCICGIYYIEDNEKDINSMISCANLAMMQIQDEYANPYLVYEDSMKSSKLSRIEVLSGFEYAIKNKEFKVYYQPIIDVKTKKVVSSEALVRWISEERGIIAPAMFIPEIEQSGYIVKLDKYVVLDVWRYVLNRKDNGLPLIPVSVNLSRMDFFVQEEIDDLLSMVGKNPLMRKYVHFEITESSYISLKERQMKFIETIRNLKGKVYLDDYGTGSASLAMVCDYNFNVIKIDRDFISKIVQNQKVFLLVKSIISMAHDLKIKVVAEGVETESQFNLLKKAHCDYVQGYLFSKPLSEEEFNKYVIEHA